MDGMRRGKSVSIPEGWSDIVFFGRLITSGICRYPDLAVPGLSAKAVYDMHRMLDFQEYCQVKAIERPDTTAQNLKRLQGMIDGGY